VGHTQRREYKKNLIPTVCEIPNCGYDVFVARHRIKPGKKGGKYVAGNVIGLCPNHHVEADLGLIPQYELFEIVQKRLKKTRKRVKARYQNGNGHTRIT